MKLLPTLKAFPADNAFFLTYNLDLLFFEYMVFDPMYLAGCRNSVVIADPQGYAAALPDMPEVRYAGQRYVITSGRTSPGGAFHPKLALLTSEDRGALFLASANLTRSGYAFNWEVVTRFHYNHKRPDPIGLWACQWGYRVLQAIVHAGKDDLVKKRLDRLWQTTPWFRQEEPVIHDDAGLWLLHNLKEPLLTQLYTRYQALDAIGVIEAVIVSPYFDTSLAALEAIDRRFQPRTWRIFTQHPTENLGKNAFERVFGSGLDRVQLADLHIEQERWLHAKAILLRTESGVWLMTGSANATAPALLQSAHRGNTEIVALRFQRDPGYFDEWLHQLTQHAQPVSLNALTTQEEPREEALSSSSKGPHILSAYLDDAGQLCIVLSESPARPDAWTVHLLQDEGQMPVSGPWRARSDAIYCVPFDDSFDIDATRPTLVAFVPAPESSPSKAILHNYQALASYSQPVRRKDRTRIPPGLAPINVEESIRIMEMLYELLAMNAEALKKHRGPVAARTRQQEVTLELEDDYNPEDFLSKRSFASRFRKVVPPSTGTILPG